MRRLPIPRNRYRTPSQRNDDHQRGGFGRPAFSHSFNRAQLLNDQE